MPPQVGSCAFLYLDGKDYALSLTNSSLSTVSRMAEQCAFIRLLNDEKNLEAGWRDILTQPRLPLWQHYFQWQILFFYFLSLLLRIPITYALVKGRMITFCVGLPGEIGHHKIHHFSISILQYFKINAYILALSLRSFQFHWHFEQLPMCLLLK